MAKAVLVLEVDAAAGKAEVKAFGKEFEAALDRIASRAGAVGSQTEAATAKLNAMLHTIPGNARPVEDAFQALGIRSSQSIDAARAKITTAFDAIKNSSAASAADVMRAHDAQEKALKKLADEAMPNLIGKQRDGTAAAGEYSGALSKVDEWLNKAGINTGFFGQAIAALVSPAGLAAVALGAVVTVMTLGVNATVEAVKEAKALAVVSGLSAEKADNLSGTMKLLGVDVGVTQGAMFRLAQELDSGAVGLTRLGIEVRKSTGEFKSEGELFLEVRDRISQMGSAGERNAALIDIFGRSGRALAGVFSMSREEFQRWMEKVGGISAVTDDTVQKTEAYTRAVGELGQRYDALKQTVGERVIPTLTEYLGLLNELLAAKDLTTTITVVLKAAGAPDSRKPFHQQIADVLLGEDLARALGRAPAFRGRGASGSWDDPAAPAAKTKTPTEIQQEKLLAQERFNAVTQGLEREAAARTSAVALGRTTQAAAAADELADLDRLQVATRAHYAEQRRLAALAQDEKGNQVKEVALAEQAAMNALVVQRADVQKRLEVLGRDFANDSVADWLKTVTTQQDLEDKKAAFLRDTDAKLLADRVAVIGTEEERFVLAEQQKLDARTRALIDQAAVDRDYAAAGARIVDEQKNRALRLQEFIRKQDGETATAQAKHLREMVQLTETATERVEREYREQQHQHDVDRANDLIGEADYQQRIRRLQDETRVKHANALIQDLQREMQVLDQRLNGERRVATQSAELRALQQQDAGEYFGFLQTQFALLALSVPTVWRGIAAVASETFDHMTRGLSDFLFAFVTGTLNAADAFRQFGLSMLRTITDFLAQQAVRTFLTVLFGGKGPNVSGLPAIFHEGGVVGGAGAGGALGLGLGPNEVLSVLERGEGVISADKMAELWASAKDLVGLGEGPSALARVAEFFSGGAGVSGMVDKLGGFIAANPSMAGGAAALAGLALQFTGNADGAKAGQLVAGLAPLIGIGTTLGAGALGGASAAGFAAAELGAIGASTAGISAGAGAAAGASAAAASLGAAAAAGGAAALVMLPLIIGSIFSNDDPNPLSAAEYAAYQFVDRLGATEGGFGAAYDLTTRTKELQDFAAQSAYNFNLVATNFETNSATGQPFAADPAVLEAGTIAPSLLLTASGETAYDQFLADRERDRQREKAMQEFTAMTGLPGHLAFSEPASLDEGGLVRIHHGEGVTPPPFADEFPGLSRALARGELVGAGAEVRALREEVRALRREMTRAYAAVANRPVVVKVGSRVVFETVRDAGKEAVKNGEQWVSERAVYPEKA